MQEKKKILFVITKGNFGGAQRYVYDLATNLPKDKFEAVVACGEGNLLKERLKEGNIRTIELEGLGREIKAEKDFQVLKNLIKIIREEKPNIVHFNSSKIGFLGALAVLCFRILNLFRASGFEFRAFFTSHGWAFNEQNRSSFSKLIFYAGHYLTVLLCDKTIAVSEKTKKDISWLPFLKNKIKVVHNGIENFKPLKKEEAKNILAGGETSKKIILSLSELHQNKGIDVAIKAVSLLPKETREKIIYCVAGEGEEKEHLQRYQEEEEITEAHTD